MNLGFAQDKETATAEKKAPAAQAARQTAEATWPEGKLTLSYGSPAWKDEFKAKMTEAEASSGASATTSRRRRP